MEDVLFTEERIRSPLDDHRVDSNRIVGVASSISPEPHDIGRIFN